MSWNMKINGTKGADFMDKVDAAFHEQKHGKTEDKITQNPGEEKKITQIRLTPDPQLDRATRQILDVQQVAARTANSVAKDDQVIDFECSGHVERKDGVGSYVVKVTISNPADES